MFSILATLIKALFTERSNKHFENIPSLRLTVGYSALGGMIGGLAASIVFRLIIPVLEDIFQIYLGGAKERAAPTNAALFGGMFGGLLGSVVMCLLSETFHTRRKRILKTLVIVAMFSIGGAVLLGVTVFAATRSKPSPELIGFFFHGAVASAVLISLVRFRIFRRSNVVFAIFVAASCGVFAYTAISVPERLGLWSFEQTYSQRGIMLFLCTVTYLFIIFTVLDVGQRMEESKQPEPPRISKP